LQGTAGEESGLGLKLFDWRRPLKGGGQRNRRAVCYQSLTVKLTGRRRWGMRRGISDASFADPRGGKGIAKNGELKGDRGGGVRSGKEGAARKA